jgi:hypothetical protein
MAINLKKHVHRLNSTIQFTANKKTYYASGRNAQAVMALVMASKAGLTHLQFQELTGSYRLSAPICNLRKGYKLNILSVPVEHEKRYVRYVLLDAVDITRVN